MKQFARVSVLFVGRDDLKLKSQDKLKHEITLADLKINVRREANNTDLVIYRGTVNSPTDYAYAVILREPNKKSGF